MPAGPNIDLDKDLYAINWFDLKRPWLYDLYTQLAYPHVRSVGGKVHFKGMVSNKIKGPDENDRQVLLIVNYPNADSFLSLLKNKSFLYKSVLRIKSVDYFTFGFVKRMGSTAEPMNFLQEFTGEHHYLLLHFKSRSQPAEIIYNLEEVITDNNLKPFFMGYKAALVGRLSDTKPLWTQPFLMDGIVLIESTDLSQLNAFISNKEFNQILGQNTTNNLYFLDRSF